MPCERAFRLNPCPSYTLLSKKKMFINNRNVLCSFKNGSLTRERIRDTYAKGSWEEFSRLLESTPRGNLGNFGKFIDFYLIFQLCISD